MHQTIRRRVVFAKIIKSPGQMNIFEGDFLRDIEAALNPQIAIERYGRTWHVSRSMIVDSGYLIGKFGFQHSGSTEEVRWDDKEEDFVTEKRPAQQGGCALKLL